MRLNGVLKVLRGSCEMSYPFLHMTDFCQKCTICNNFAIFFCKIVLVNKEVIVKNGLSRVRKGLLQDTKEE